MIGKLVVWRGEHRKDGPEKTSRIGTGLGGFVPLDQLESAEDAKPRSKSPGRPLGKRSPKHFLQKRKPSLQDQELFETPATQATVKPISRHIPLFANIPGYEQATDYDRQAGYDIRRPPSTPAKSCTSLSRPQTADATIWRRRRSKTAESRPSCGPPESLANKPLPLPDKEKSRPRASETPKEQSSEHKRRSSTAKQSALAGKRNQSDTNLLRRPSDQPYSLTPSAKQSEGRRASQSTKVTSPTSASQSGSTKSHHRAGSATSTRSTATVVKAKSPTKSRTSADRAILDEVEGTLSATITELQELNALWHGHSPPLLPEIHPALRDQAKPSPPLSSSTPQSTPDNFAPGTNRSSAAQTQRSSQSLPPTPFAPTRPSSATALQSAHDVQRHLHAEIDDLRTQLTVVLKRIAESDAVRLERDKYARELNEARARCQELGVAAEGAVNKLVATEGRLEEANVQKVDVLEENGELREKVRALLKEVRRQEAEGRKRQSGGESSPTADLPSVVADLTFQLDDAEKAAREREGRIKELEQANALLKDELQQKQDRCAEIACLAEQTQQKIMNDCQLGAAKIVELTQKLDAKANEVRIAQNERDKFEQLLLAEFRRTAIEIHARTHPSESLLSQKMDVEAAVKQIRTKAESNLREGKNGRPDHEGSAHSGDDTERRIEDLEKEVEYYLKDIVLYKLDVRGYKKDLRRALNKIQELEQWSKEKGLEHKGSAGSPSTPPQARLPRQSQGKAPRELQPPVDILQQQTDGEIRNMEQRPSISAQSDDSTAPPLSIGSTACEASPETPKAEAAITGAFPVPEEGADVQTYQPSGSPARKAAGGLGMF